jgi:hypothetical protein
MLPKWPAVDARWRVQSAFERPRPRATLAACLAESSAR